MKTLGVRLGTCCCQQHPPVHLFAAPWLHGTIVHLVQLLCSVCDQRICVLPGASWRAFRRARSTKQTLSTVTSRRGMWLVWGRCRCVWAPAAASSTHLCTCLLRLSYMAPLCISCICSVAYVISASVYCLVHPGVHFAVYVLQCKSFQQRPLEVGCGWCDKYEGACGPLLLPAAPTCAPVCCTLPTWHHCASCAASL